METQTNLFDAFEKTTMEKFNTFDIKNPKIYRLFEKFTFMLIEAGHRKIGEKYGERIESRLWEMFNIVLVKGNDRRK